MIKKRGYLATVLLVLAVVGGYVGLLPLLASLSADPALPAAPAPVASANLTVPAGQKAIASASGHRPPVITVRVKPRKHKLGSKKTAPVPQITLRGVNDGANGGTSTGSGGTPRTEPQAPDTGAVSGSLSSGGASGPSGGQICAGSSC